MLRFKVKIHFNNKEIINDTKKKIKKKKKTYKKMLIKNEWSVEARQLTYQAIVIKGYRSKHLSTMYTDSAFVIIFDTHSNWMFNGWSSFFYEY